MKNIKFRAKHGFLFLDADNFKQRGMKSDEFQLAFVRKLSVLIPGNNGFTEITR